MTMIEKVAVARQLARLRVDVIEAGYPAASDGDFAAVHEIARVVGGADGPAICGLARASARDIDRCWEAVEPAVSARIHIFLATSDVHMKHKLGMTRPQVVAAATASVSRACAHGADVEFSAEDAARSDPAFLYEVLTAALEAGATTLNVPDTVGYSTPDEYGALVEGVRANVPGVERVTISAHCHDDLGLAVANSLAAVRAGARQAECTINGIGERAGNAALEEFVMALHTRRAFFGLYTNIETPRARAHVAPRLGVHRDRRAAQQGDRRRERVFSRGRYPPGRRAQEPAHLRDNERGYRRVERDQPRARQALGAPRAAGEDGVARLRADRCGAQRAVHAVQGAC